MIRHSTIFLVTLFILSTVCSDANADDRVEFNRDIRPILSDNCFACHGPDEKTRQAELRLDLLDASRKPLPSGKVAVVPGKSAESELVRRIVSVDANAQMPPADSGKHLTSAQITLLRRWVEQGAEYQAHWSFVPLTRPKLPPVMLEPNRLARNAIDNFVLSRLSDEKLSPSPEADSPLN